MKIFHLTGLLALTIVITFLTWNRGPKVQMNASKGESSFPLTSTAQDTADWPFPCNQETIERYTAYYTSTAPNIDGKLDEDLWKKRPVLPDLWI